ncbi:MAG TPA: tyrosine-type recombinase/integrase, partial [Anaerovoracaceae bacterium]|nr:tyrosine-type recombinase/integrase [Anaerovoracaceae bacterium]
TMAIEIYLAYRSRAVETEDKERLEQLEKQRVTSDNDYLFISRAVPDDYLIFYDLDKSKKENAKIKEEMRKLETTAIMAIYRRLSEKAQMSAPSGDWNIIRSHNLRRFFNTTLLNAGASIFLVDYAMGHALDSTHDGYYRNDPQKLREHYSEYVHLLTINKETDEELMQKYEEGVKKSKALEIDVVKMAIERTELQDLREQLELERADRYEYERNVNSFIDLKIAEFSKKMMHGFNESLEDMKKNMKNKPIELKDE